MITDALLSFVYLFIFAITAPLRLFDNVSLSADLISAIATANTYISAVDFIFPVTTFLAILALVLTIEAFILFYKLTMWVIKKIPTIS